MSATGAIHHLNLTTSDYDGTVEFCTKAVGWEADNRFAGRGSSRTTQQRYCKRRLGGFRRG